MPQIPASGLKCVRVCAHVCLCIRVLACVTANGKHSKPIWLMHIWYQMEHNPHKYKGLNTLQYSLPRLDPANFQDEGGRWNEKKHTTICSQKMLGDALSSAAWVDARTLEKVRDFVKGKKEKNLLCVALWKSCEAAWAEWVYLSDTNHIEIFTLDCKLSAAIKTPTDISVYFSLAALQTFVFLLERAHFVSFDNM